jgi:outer membrane protein TolC
MKNVFSRLLPRWQVRWVGVLFLGLVVGGPVAAQILPGDNVMDNSGSSNMPNPLHNPTVPFSGGGNPVSDNGQMPDMPDLSPEEEAQPPQQPDLTSPAPGSLPTSSGNFGGLARSAALVPDEQDAALAPFVEFPFPEPGQPLPPSEARLQRILMLAATDSPLMRSQAEAITTYDASRYRSWMRYLPQVSAKYDVGAFDTIRGNQNVQFGGAYTVEAAKPLYYWGALEAAEQLAFLKESIAQMDAVIAYARMCEQLRRRYYTLIQVKAELKAYTAEVETQRIRLDKQRELEAHSTGTPTETSQMEFNLRNLELRTATLKTGYLYRITEFRRVAGVLDFDENDVPDYIIVPKVNVDQLRDEFKEFRRTGYSQTLPAKETSLRQDAFDQYLVMNASRLKPNFNIGVGITQGPYQENNNKGGSSVYFQTILFAGITGSWDIFDNYQTSSNSSDLLAERQVVETRALTNRDQLFSEAANALDTVEIGQQGIDLYKQELTLLQDSYRREKARMRLGEADTIDVDTLRDNILETRFDILIYQCDLAEGYYDFLSALFRDPALVNVDSYKHTTLP